MFWAGEEAGEVAAARVWEGGKGRVGVDALEEVDDRRRRRLRGRMGGGQEGGEFGVVACGGEAKGFHGDFTGVEFVGVAQVDEWVA